MDNVLYVVGIFAILDVKAAQVSGGVYSFKHQAQAVRFFSDLAQQKDTFVNRHTADYNLIRLGYLTHEHVLVPDYEEILTGAALMAATEAAP